MIILYFNRLLHAQSVFGSKMFWKKKRKLFTQIGVFLLPLQNKGN